MGYDITNKRHSCYFYYKEEQMRKDKSFDYYIKCIVSSKFTFAIFTINHAKIDGGLFNNICRNILSEYSIIQPPIIKPHKGVRIKCGYTLLPIKQSFVDKLAAVYPYSKNVIMQSIWSLYFNYKFGCKMFSQVINIRGSNSQNGNCLYIDAYNTANTLNEMCYNIQCNIEQVKMIKRTQFTFISSLMNGTSYIIFNNWSSLTPHEIGSIYYESNSDISSGYLPNLLIISKQNNCYVLIPFMPKLLMHQTDMSDFKEFCQRIN
jgi:hypothetical protein